MKYYIAYGSNLSVDQMAFRCPDATVVGKATLEGWRLVFRYHATVERCEGSSVPVLVWAISKRDEGRLDRYEGYPKYYVKQTLSVPVEAPSGRLDVQAMIYLMSPGRPVTRPSGAYFNVISEGYKRFGFDLGILHQALEDSWFYEGFMTYK